MRSIIASLLVGLTSIASATDLIPIGKTHWKQTSQNGTPEFLDDPLKYPPLQASGRSMRIKPPETEPSATSKHVLANSYKKGDTVWVSFLMHPEKVASGHAYLVLGEGKNAFSIGKKWGNRFAINNASTNRTVSGGTTHLLVAKVEIQGSESKISLWVNPDVTTKPSSETVAKTTTLPVNGINWIATNVQGYGKGSYVFSAIRTGKKWNDVAPIDTAPFEVKLATVSKNASTKFYVTAQLPISVDKLNTTDLALKNGRITKITGSNRIFNIAVEPMNPGKVLIVLQKNVIRKGNLRNKRSNIIEVDYDPKGSGPKITKFKTEKSYRPYIAGAKKVNVWLGRRVAFIVEEDANPAHRSQAAMGEIVNTFDQTLDLFDEIVGRKPDLSAPYEGRVRMEMAVNVGGGLAHHGRYGIAIARPIFDELYESVLAGAPRYRPAYFYEMNRNYWLKDLNPKIDYHTSNSEESYGWWTVGFNNAMAVIIAERLGVELTGGSSGFANHNTNLLDTYISGKEEYTWENTWHVDRLPWAPKTSLNSLMTGLLLRLSDNHGGKEFMKNLYHEIPKLKKLPSNSAYQKARDNFFLASSRAAKKNLFSYFTETLRWKISPEANAVATSEF